MPRAPSTCPAPRRSARCWPLPSSLLVFAVGAPSRGAHNTSALASAVERPAARTAAPRSGELCARRCRLRVLATLTEHVHELPLRRLQEADQLGQRPLDGAD